MRRNMSKNNGMKRSYADKIFDIVNIAIMIVMLVIFAWPIWFVIIASISDPNQVWLGNVVLLPKEITIKSYQAMLEYKDIWIGYRNTILYTVSGTIVNLVMSVCCAYPLSRSDFMLRKPILGMLMFTMYFGGGLIPSYLLMSDLNLVNNPFVMIISGAMSVYNMLIVKNYFTNSIPKELQEAAFLDGASSAQYLIKVVLPLSKPVLAVVGLYYGVAHWNNFYTALVYLYDKRYFPLQTFLRDLLLSTQLNANSLDGADAAAAMEAAQMALTMKYSVIIVSALPLICVYPFVQKFFVKGVMVGSVKG